MNDNQIALESNLREIEKEMISDLRDEATEAKKCFTTFSFQTIAFSTAIIGFIFKSIPDNPIAALSAVPGIAFLMIVCRIGIYKYQTASRAYGYQFYLEQARNFQDETNEKRAWQLIIETRGWEQVLRVWRIIHPTIFKRIYVTPSSGKIWIIKWILNSWCAVSPGMYRRSNYANSSIRDNEVCKKTVIFVSCFFMTEKLYKFKSIFLDIYQDSIYLWCFLDHIAKKRIELKSKKRTVHLYSAYKPGTYLKNMLLISYVLQFIFIVSLCLATYAVYIDSSVNGKDLGINIVLPISLIIMLPLTISRVIRIERRRNIIENELYSIHSCEIIWQIVVLAHYRSTMKTKSNPCDLESNKCDWYSRDKAYLECIGLESQEIIKNLFTLDRWVNKKEEAYQINSGNSLVT